MRAHPIPRPLALVLALAAACLLAAGTTAAAPNFRVQAPEAIPLGAGVGIADVAAGDVNHDGIPELAVFESDRRVHVYQRVLGVWTNVYTTSLGAGVWVPANETPTVRFTDEEGVRPSGYAPGQFLFNAQLPGVAIASIRLSGTAWSESTLFGPLAFIPHNGAFSPPVRMRANNSAPLWRVVVPGAYLYDPLFRAWLPRFGESAPHACVVREWCEQIGPSMPGAVGGDVNGDGETELVMLRPDVVMVTNPSDAPLGGNPGCWPVEFVSATPQFAPHAQIVGGHFDGDAREDLLVRDVDGRIDVIWFASGGPPYSTQVSSMPSTQPGGSNLSTDLVAADLDDDGDLDFVQTYSDPPGFEVWLNDGSRSFTATFTPLDSTYGSASCVDVLDADGDGHLDLAIGQPEALRSRVLLLPGDGAGHFGSPAGVALGTLEPSAIAADDFDQDGAVDLAIGGHDTDLLDGQQDVQLLHASGGGAFEAPAPMNTPFTDLNSGVRRLLPFVQDEWTGRSLAAMQVGTYAIAYGTPNGLPSGMFVSWAPFEMTGLANGDLDGEPSQNELVSLNLNEDGTSTIFEPIMDPITIAGSCAGLALVDWNRDGHLDLVTLNRTLARIEVHLQSASTPLTFPTVLTYALSIEPLTWYDHGAPFVVVDDPGGQGYVTLVAVGSDATSGDLRSQLFHNRAPSIGPVLDVSASPAGISTAIASGDVDGDGVPDVVFGEVADGTLEGYVSVWRGVAGGPLQFTHGATYVVADAEVNDVAVADVTGDGHDDILCATHDNLVPAGPNKAHAITVGPGAGGRFAAMPARQVPVGETAAVPTAPPPSHTSTLALSVGPNPLTGHQGRVTFTLPGARRVRAELVDVAGRVMRTLADADLAAGPHALAFDTESGGRLASGVYFVQLRAGRDVATRRIVVVH